jgi:hypothetical protein
MLLENDKLLRDCLNALYTEIAAARGGEVDLDTRLDGMEGQTANITLLSLEARAQSLRKLYHWGQLLTKDDPDSDTTLFPLQVLTGWSVYPQTSMTYAPRQIYASMYNENIVVVPGGTWIVNGYALDVSQSLCNTALTLNTTFTNAIGGAVAPKENWIKMSDGPPSSNTGRYDLIFLEVWRQTIPVGTPVFYPLGNVLHESGTTTDDPTDSSVVETIDVDANGDYVQLRYRLRVVEDVDWETWLWSSLLDPTDPLTDVVTSEEMAGIVAQGPKAAPDDDTATFDYFQDSLLHRVDASEAGPSSEMVATLTGESIVDDEVYGIPIAVISRRNRSGYTPLNQNGGSSTAPAANRPNSLDYPSDRPDWKYANRIYSDEIIDLRPHIANNIDWTAMVDTGLYAVLRGATSWLTPSMYDHDNNDVWDDSVARCSTPLWIDRIDDNAEQWYNTVRDWGITADPVAIPDNIRTMWSGGPVSIRVAIGLTEDSDTEDIGADILTYNSTTKAIAINTTAISGNPDVVIAASPDPVLYWPDGTTVDIDTGDPWSGLGTSSAGCSIDSTDAAAHAGEAVRGYVILEYAAGSGLNYRPKKVWKQQVDTYEQLFYGLYGQFYSPQNPDNSSDLSIDQAEDGVIGPGRPAVDASNNVYIPNKGAHAVTKLSSTFAHSADFGTWGTAGNDATHLDNPCAVAVDSAGNVYVADTGNDRIVKLTSGLIYTTAFTSLDTPVALAVADDPSDSGTPKIYVVLRGAVNKIQKLHSATGAMEQEIVLTGDYENVYYQGVDVTSDGKFVVWADNNTISASVIRGVLRAARTSDLSTGTDIAYGSGDPSDLTDVDDLACIRDVAFGTDFSTASEPEYLYVSNGYISPLSNHANAKNFPHRVSRFFFLNDGTDPTLLLPLNYIGVSSRQRRDSGDDSWNGLACFPADNRMIISGGMDSTVAGWISLFHASMACISNGGRNVQTLVPIPSTSDLRVWYTGAGYHGITVHMAGATPAFASAASPLLSTSKELYVSTRGSGTELEGGLANCQDETYGYELSTDCDFGGSLPLDAKDYEYAVNEVYLDMYTTGLSDINPGVQPLRNLDWPAPWGREGYWLDVDALEGAGSGVKYGGYSRGSGLAAQAIPYFLTIPSPSSTPRYLVYPTIVYNHFIGPLLCIQNFYIASGTANKNLPGDELDTYAGDFFMLPWNLRLPKNSIQGGHGFRPSLPNLGETYAGWRQ